MDSSINLCLRYENRTVYAESSRRQLPVTLLTGFLGAGKTTLLQQILANKQQLHIAAAVNDFAAINIDAALVVDSKDKQRGVVELSNGCLCCSLADDLQDTVGKLLQGDFSQFGSGLADVDYLVIESSGVADPLAVVELLERRYGRMTRARLDSVVCVCDAEAIAVELEERKEEEAAGREKGGKEEEGEKVRRWTSHVALAQLQMADVVLLNKMDLVSEERVAEVELWLRTVAPQARVHRCTRGRVPLQHILDVELQKAADGVVQHEVGMAPFVLVPHTRQLLRQADTRALATGRSEETKKLLATHRQHLEQELYNNVSFESKEPLSLAAFQDLLCQAPSNGGLPDSVVRMKGFVAFAGVDVPRRFTFHWSGNRRYDCVTDVAASGSSCSSLVVIGRDLDREAVSRTLHGAVWREEDEDRQATETDREEAEKLINSDRRFELLAASGPSIVAFRLTGEQGSGSNMAEMETTFGVDFFAMNDSLARSVSGRSGRQFLLPPTAEEFALRWALGGRTKLADVWSLVAGKADDLLAVHLAAVRQCKCGF